MQLPSVKRAQELAERCQESWEHLCSRKGLGKNALGDGDGGVGETI